MRKSIKSLLFASAFAPVLVTLGLTLLYSVGWTLTTISAFAAFVLLSLLGWLIIIGISKHGETMPIKLKKIEPLDFLIVRFLAGYSVPAVLKAINLSSEAIGSVVLFLFALGMMLTYVPMHPFLHLIGYRFYKCETDGNIVITIIVKRTVRKITEIKEVIRISDNLYIEKELN